MHTLQGIQTDWF